MGLQLMLHCQCGYTCGIKAALDRHLAKFVGTEFEHEHGPSLPVPSLPARGVRSAPLLEFGKDFYESSLCDELSPNTQKGIPSDCMGRTSTMVTSTKPAMADSMVRLLLVRHAQSANKAREPGCPAEADPGGICRTFTDGILARCRGLTELGFRQAAALAERLQKELRSVKLPHLTLVSSPMRRCIYTIQPAIQALQPQAEHTLCHGGSYEFGCAGKVHPGSSLHELLQEFPEFSPVGFSADGFWDYQGCNDKETEPECRARVMRLVTWLMAIARTRGGPKGHTIVLVTHQTINDLLCSILLDGTAAVWKYGQVRYRLQNAGITEVFVAGTGEARLGVRNDGAHLLSIK
mmetsp:Transcript_61491/g.143965  ORF Transcript_61491/g.143965 Transcript_61491/m.143965 type:complete len:349 (-) Transcript_61491:22-1068(-)